MTDYSARHPTLVLVLWKYLLNLTKPRRVARRNRAGRAGRPRHEQRPILAVHATSQPELLTRANLHTVYLHCPFVRTRTKFLLFLFLPFSFCVLVSYWLSFSLSLAPPPPLILLLGRKEGRTTYYAIWEGKRGFWHSTWPNVWVTSLLCVYDTWACSIGLLGWTRLSVLTLVPW